MQSSAILHVMYCDRLTAQLAAQEERQKEKKKGQLNGDGLVPKLLTSDELYTQVVEYEKAVEQDKVDREKSTETTGGTISAHGELERNSHCRMSPRTSVLLEH